MTETTQAKKRIETHEAEDALLRATRQLNFISIGLAQDAFQWTEESIWGLNFLLFEIEGKLDTVYTWFHQGDGYPQCPAQRRETQP